jgi:hypothetical protein
MQIDAFQSIRVKKYQDEQTGTQMGLGLMDGPLIQPFIVGKSPYYLPQLL